MADTTTILTRAEVLHCIRQDLDRAYADAEKRLTEATYDVHGGLWTGVEIRACSHDGQKISKYQKVGQAVNFRRWEEEGA